MSFYATTEMKVLKDIFKSRFKTFKSSEFYIVEGSASGNGYHHSREDLINRGRTGAYSIQHSLDKKGDAKAASAFDLLFSDDKELWLATKRLNDAARAKDPRIFMKVREFGGTLDGKKVTAYNVTEQRTITFDSSHLWHLHVSVHRAYTQDAEVLRGIADVLTGVPLVVTPPPTSGGGGTIPEAPKPTPKPEPKVINKYIVDTATLNVRSSGSTASSRNIVGTVKRGTKVMGYEVTSGGRKWVVDARGSYFALEFLRKYVTYVVTTDKLNGRSGPSTSHKIVGKKNRGAYVLVFKTVSGGGYTWGVDAAGVHWAMKYLKKA